MTYNKLNVLHWHITDDQAWPMEVKSRPKLWEGSFSMYERYAQIEISKVVEYGRKRGIRVVGEIDTPGHANAICVGNPEVCPSQDCKSPLDPTKEETFNLLNDVLGELINEKDGLLKDDYFHIGGDEVNMNCWDKVDHIVKWKEEHGYTNNDVYKYMVDFVTNITLKHNKLPVVWEEVYNHFGTNMIKGTVVHVWLSRAPKLKDIVSKGYYGILSGANPWYLPRKYSWKQCYENPIDEDIPEEQKYLVLGGGAAMWGEYVDISDFMYTVYPRASAVAERLWTVKEKLDVEAAKNRLNYFRYILHRRGIEAEIVNANEGRINPPGPGSLFNQ